MNYEAMDAAGFMGGWGGMAFGGLLMVFWLALIIGLIVLLVRWLSATPVDTASPGQDTLEILKQRFARGEIDTQEFEERTRQLRGAA